MPVVDTEIVRAYIKLLKLGRAVSVREFQRLMGYTSPGKAQRILERMVREGLATRNSDGLYEPVKDVAPQLGLVVLRRIVVPRRLAIACSTTMLALIYAMLAEIDIVTRCVMIAITIPYLIDAIRTLKTYIRISR